MKTRRRSVRRAATGRFVRRARKVRRNPAIRRAKRPSPPKMTPAMRAKISRAVKAANRRRAASRGVVARVSSRVRSVIRRRSGGGSVAIRSRRRSVRRSGGGGGAMAGGIKGAFSKPMLLKAGGAIAASMGVGYILKSYGAKLPMATSKYGRVIYSLAIPIGVAMLVRKKSPDLAQGLIIGGLVMAVTEIIRAQNAPAGAALSAYPADMRVTSVKNLPGFGVAGELGFNAYPTGINSMGTRVESPAFNSNIWGN